MSGNERLYGFFFIYSTLSSLLFGEKLGDGCGHSTLGPESGVLSSKNYPGTYPNNTWCQVTIRVPEGNGIIVKFADLDIEAKECESDSLASVRILKGAYGNDPVCGPSCRNLKMQPRDPVHIDSSEITVQFCSGVHVSGRGFLLSYATREHKDLLTCLDRGSHFPSSQYTKYCPAGCKAVAGDISGDVAQGYRHVPVPPAAHLFVYDGPLLSSVRITICSSSSQSGGLFSTEEEEFAVSLQGLRYTEEVGETSVLCKAAVHAGVILDEVGGAVSVERHKGLSHYAAARANGIQSRDGSLSDALFTFVTNDSKKQTTLHPVSVNASSWCQRCLEAGRPRSWSPNGTLPVTGGRTWAPEQDDRKQWLQLDLGEKKKITGVVTTGSTALDFDYYVQSYKIEYKERNRWKTYTQNGQLRLHARSVRVVPYTWHHRIALRVELLGCPYVKANLPSQITPETERPNHRGRAAREHDEGTTWPVTSQADIVQLTIIIASTVVGVLLVLAGICVFKALQKKKTKETPYGATDVQETGCWKQIQRPFSRHQSTEFTISYSSEKDPIQKLDLVTSTMAEYQQPLMIGTGTVARKGSTFRPMDTETKDESPDPAAAPLRLPAHGQPEAFLPDPSYSVPGMVLSKTPSFNATDCGPHRKAAGGLLPDPPGQNAQGRQLGGRLRPPKVSAPLAPNGTGGDYQTPQVKPSVTESYSSPRDCVKAEGAAPRKPAV
ncbi:hypothetical protein SKAU_G00186910 [Synaphobranchus kaupii]|uniref:Discoidin, CUB and LCCL domain containing 1 n=1 Tax=Synaphobranchus kaupii TaxID=118154 RepID=A0A9Q1IUT8_SYNKA|nr:hypothetical protein SKAU_G00186910 [Synaphobranchus kaupii]